MSFLRARRRRHWVASALCLVLALAAQLPAGPMGPPSIPPRLLRPAKEALANPKLSPQEKVKALKRYWRRAIRAEPDTRARILAALKALGYQYVALDLEGYRTGSLNEVL